MARLTRHISKRLRSATAAITLTILSSSHAIGAQAESNTVIDKFDMTALCSLVDKKTPVALKYYYDGEAAPQRIVHPYAVGYTPSKNVLLFGLQVGGYSKSAASNNAKGWRSFRTDKIKTLVALESTYTAVAADYPKSAVIVRYACKAAE
jgi:predicted DNA-binding transcriptional regulator YafY